MPEGTTTPTPTPAPAGGEGGQQAMSTPTPAEVAAGVAARQQAPAAQQATPAEPGDNLPDDPAALKAEIARLRKENAGDRTAAKTKAADDARTALAQDIGKALGLIKDDTTPDPAALTAQLTAQQSAARESALELAVYKAAGVKGANPDALLDSRSFLATVQDLDPTDTAAIQAAIDQAVTTNPSFKAVQVAAASTVQHPGGSGETAVTPDQFAAMKPAQKAALFNTNPTLYRTLTGTI